MKRWSRHLNVTLDQLQAAIEKVGNSVTAVEKELQNLVEKT